MTESPTRAVPTPADITAGRRPTPTAPPAPAASYDRHRWEEALLVTELPHSTARLLGWGLAHRAGTAGYLPPGTASDERLARALRLSVRQVRMSLTQLEAAGLIGMPHDGDGQPRRRGRRITLTLPSDDQAHPQPPSTGEVA